MGAILGKMCNASKWQRRFVAHVERPLKMLDNEQVKRHSDGDIDRERDGQCHRQKQARVCLGYGDFHGGGHGDVRGTSR